MCNYLLKKHRNFDQVTKKVLSGVDPRVIFLNQVTESSDHTFTLRLALQAAPTFELFSYLWNTFDPNLFVHPLTLITVARFIRKFKSEWSSEFLASPTTRFVYGCLQSNED